MVRGGVVVEDPSMRDPAHLFYDQACDLLGAAQGLRATSQGREVAPAIPAALGCLEASLQALADAIDELGRQATSTSLHAERRFVDLAWSLRSTGDIAGALRARVAESVATVIP